MVGKRIGYGKDNMAPHSMTLTMVGASMLWVGWFGFNAGSNLEANGGAALAMINTFAPPPAPSSPGWSSKRWPRQGLDARRGIRHDRRPRGRHPGLRAVGPIGAIVLGASPARSATSSWRW
jgi:ammonium transporter, Amt family